MTTVTKKTKTTKTKTTTQTQEAITFTLGDGSIKTLFDLSREITDLNAAASLQAKGMIPFAGKDCTFRRADRNVRPTLRAYSESPF